MHAQNDPLGQVGELMKIECKKIIIGLLLVVLVIILILESSFAFFSDYILSVIGMTSGTVRLKPITFLIDGKDEPITNWKPGDVILIEWTVENAGNKSIYTKDTLEIAWNVEEDIKETEQEITRI